ncbi:hypothetical protein B0T10DRAFT_569523 [Thelonectria olida]|uniref:Uncharacterized protein n=1 Tax=Thelonectria olida TaxID=1576542 RepID=A0A9P9AJ04_9HYPO|nr:hypothetical protein B0T10DRAFT_569523 [Thelonectria olida]
MANSPYAHFPNAFWEVEWRVNGIWNGILNDCFPRGVHQDQWIVAPEVYSTWFNTNGVRADLCVTAIEGEEDEYAQILNWCTNGVQNYQPFCCWAVGTKGKYVTFYAFDGVNLHPLGLNGGQIVKDANVNPEDITTPNGWAFVHQVLTAANNNPNLTAAEIANDNF